MKNRDIYKKIVYFFPIQLVLVHLKKNQTILVFWLILFGLITQNTAVKYGIPYLFLDPEYLDKVGFASFLLVGFACGGFIMAYNIASYIRNSFRFPFLATLSNPFLKYCINNSIIPLAFIFTYIYMIIYFQSRNQFASVYKEMIDILGFLIGNLIFILISLSYFNKTNKDIFKMFGIGTDDSKSSRRISAKSKLIYVKGNKNWKAISHKEDRDWHVETYLSRINRIRIARGFEHYDKVMLRAVYKQNHKNAALFQLLVIISVIVLGLLRDISFFNIPAATSIFLLFTAILMITSAMYSFLRGWTTAVFIVILLLLNYLSGLENFHVPNKIVGVSYNKQPVKYNNALLNKLSTDTASYRNDFNNTLKILENWKLRMNNFEEDSEAKPKIVFINTSGGGLRSSMWVTKALLHLDSITSGKLLKSTILITGSSGGAIGAAFVREIILHKQTLSNNSEKYVNQISRDMLDPITLSIATNDLFLRLKKIEYNNEFYIKDRGITLEEKINANCLGWFNKDLADYQIPEYKAQVPMMIFAPTIMNDGRRLLISSQGISYLTKKNILFTNDNSNLIEAVEYQKLFSAHNAENTRFSSVLRMSASFPYISPMANLPSEPAIEVMDAGVRDNYGITTTIQFIHCFRNWLAENTSGIIIIQLRDRKKQFTVEENPLNSFTQTLTSPIGSFYDNLFHIQDYNFDQLIKYTNSWYPGKIEILNLQLRNNNKERISLSWHLTEREKLQVHASIYEYENVQNFNKIKKLIEP